MWRAMAFCRTPCVRCGQRILFISETSRLTGLQWAIQSARLTAQHSLHLVRLGDRALLIGLSATQCSVLDVQPWKDLNSANQLTGPEPLR